MKRLLEEAEEYREALKKVLKDKEDEISQSMKLLCRAKKDAIKEYRDSDALLVELGGSFADSFDDCLHQVKASFLNMDLSHNTIDAKAKLHPIWLNLKEPMRFLLMISILTLKLTGRPFMLTKKNPSWAVSANLKRTRRLRSRRKRPPLPSFSFLLLSLFLLLCILSIFVHLRELYLFLLSPLVFGFL